ncbi:C45 family autoproteolytic acyltransferase/hydolase [Pandoraea sp. PE-S2T-3]|uniref:C45 family autoproteolytic acyltransferase/hydolase n=1 Tax=Pandoraea sp. PE-S2T-3 TaxID=1986993 RepID=UPI000B3F68BF|nr:C45 family peptidase [Pandoraea sp. PE-S2T-3]
MHANEAFPLVDVSGTPFERGLAHGRQVPERVARSLALYRTQLDRRGVSSERQQALARRMVPTIEAFDATYLEEMRGIAEGANVTLEDVVIINCRTEMMYGHDEIGEARKALDDGCTGLIVMPQASTNGRLLHAHNWDWRAECADTGIVLRMRRDDGPDLLVFTEAGTLGRHGINSAGLSLSGNFLTSDRDYVNASEANTPLSLIRRRMLDSTSLADAMKALWNTRRYASNNLMLADARGEAVNLECAPDEIFWLTPTDDLLVHANHWLCPVARTKLRDLGLAKSPDSIYRQRRVTAGLNIGRERFGKIDWTVIKGVLADDFGSPVGVLRVPRKVSFDSIAATVCTTLMDAADGVLWIARKPYESREFVEYRLR